MIVPSIDLMNGRTVQLIGGRDFELDAGDPIVWAEKFGLVGDVAIVDLDAALGRGSNREVIKELCKTCRCRVGGGIRSVETAIEWLDAGAESVVLGTAARPEILKELPRERVVAALDSVNDEVVVEGWKRGTGTSVLDRIAELKPFVGGFLVTFVEREGRLGGTRLDAAEQIARAAEGVRVTIAGGVTTAEEVAALDRMGCDAQVGMALYKGLLPLADAFAAPLVSDRPDGLWPTVVVDEHDVALGLVYSNLESLRQAIETRRGVYFSRSRNGIWLKGESSGATQELLEVSADCDRDALRFRVRQSGTGFCHLETHSCWGSGGIVPELSRRLKAYRDSAPTGSYTQRLLNDPELLRKKLIEEVHELTEAADSEQTSQEAADVLYFLLTKIAAENVTWEKVEKVLDFRRKRVTRRPGNAKSN
ncbi:MAG: phosphoribosyl-ATP diphosphatase [Pirellulaceae bacterium]|nr:phosphoribosyl-ATP diphosphatase [Pirellulaceae bacterium]